MTMSPDQAMEASVFLTLYKEAITSIEQIQKTYRESAFRNASNEVVQNFTDEVIKNSHSGEFRRLCNPVEKSKSKLSMSRFNELIKDVRAFQFSQYMFSKYLPQWSMFQGNGQDVIKFLREKSNLIEKDLRN